MKNKIRLHFLGRGLCICIRKTAFTVEDARLIVEDIITIFLPWRSTRLLMIAGTNAYYSEVPLFSSRHRLLCYTYCADALKKRKPSFYKHALILGLGGGTVPRWLLEEYPSLSVDVVDYSAQIIAVCKKYFLQKWENSDRLKYYCTDAQAYEPPAYQYQFIFCDLFDGEKLVPCVYSPDFAKKLRTMLCDDGLLIINCGWSDHLQEVQDAYRKEFAHLQLVDREPWQTDVIEACNIP